MILAGITDNSRHIEKVLQIADKVTHLAGIDLLPYHAYGKDKYAALGIPDAFDDVKYVPQAEKMQELNAVVRNYLHRRGL